MYLSITCHPPVPVDHEVPHIVVVSTTELGSNHKLVDASNQSSEHTCVIVVGGALVHRYLVKDDGVELNISQLTLVGSEKKNNVPWDTGSCLNQMLKDCITVPADFHVISNNE